MSCCRTPPCWARLLARRSNSASPPFRSTLRLRGTAGKPKHVARICRPSGADQGAQLPSAGLMGGTCRPTRAHFLRHVWKHRIWWRKGNLAGNFCQRRFDSIPGHQKRDPFSFGTPRNRSLAIAAGVFWPMRAMSQLFSSVALGCISCEGFFCRTTCSLERPARVPKAEAAILFAQRRPAGAAGRWSEVLTGGSRAKAATSMMRLGRLLFAGELAGGSLT